MIQKAGRAKARTKRESVWDRSAREAGTARRELDLGIAGAQDGRWEEAVWWEAPDAKLP